MLEATTDCGLAILAGGRSRRFEGRAKAFLPWRGKALVRRAWETLGPHCRHTSFVVSDLLSWGEFADDLRLEGRALPIFLSDGHPGTGLPGALRSALEGALDEWILAVPCDLPFPAAEMLFALAGLRAPGVAAVCPRRGPHREPLFALYHRASCLAPLSELIAAGERRLCALYERIPHRHLEGAALEALLTGFPHDPFTNVNDDEAWNRLQKEGSC